MSRKILCPDCEKSVSELANQYDELFESVEGRSKEECFCDDCGVSIFMHETCFATVLLPNRSHFNYERQKPSSWMHDYINPLISV